MPIMVLSNNHLHTHLEFKSNIKHNSKTTYATIQKLAILILFLIIILLCYTYLGIAKARDNSPLLVFTDADAKDAHRLQEVIDAAIEQPFGKLSDCSLTPTQQFSAI
jgi:hypothetical protein